jgi:hypothetical protein
MDAELADRIRQAAIKFYASLKRPVRVSRSHIGRAANLSRVVCARSAYPRCNGVLDELAETQWHFCTRRYVWTRMRGQDTSSGSKFWLRSGIGYYQFVELHVSSTATASEHRKPCLKSTRIALRSKKPHS